MNKPRRGNNVRIRELFLYLLTGSPFYEWETVTVPFMATEITFMVSLFKIKVLSGRLIQLLYIQL